MAEDELARLVIEQSLKIHRQIGPGLLESVYEEVLYHELIKTGIQFKRQQAIAVYYDGVKLDLGFRADLIIEDKLIIEIKSVEALSPVHAKILQTCLRLSNKKLGLLINFNVELIKHGIKRIVNNL